MVLEYYLIKRMPESRSRLCVFCTGPAVTPTADQEMIDRRHTETPVSPQCCAYCVNEFMMTFGSQTGLLIQIAYFMEDGAARRTETVPTSRRLVESTHP